VHIQYSYDTKGIVLVNHALDDVHGLQANIRVRNLDGSVRYEKHLQGIDLAGNHTHPLTTLPAIANLSTTYFIELELAAADGKPVSRNVYWLSTRADVLDWAKSNWYLTPLTQYGDLTALKTLPAATSEVHATTQRDGNDEVTTVTLSVPASSKAVALFQHVSIKRGAQGALALPIRWTDNDVTLWPGESIVLTARYAAQGTADPVVEVSGWNVPVQSVAAGATHSTDH
jgi:exo-1,4-beta-D-glucosaminidase